jgi:hypothetical protein
MYVPSDETKNVLVDKVAAEEWPWLPDSIFFKPKIPIWINLGGSCNGLY